MKRITFMLSHFFLVWFSCFIFIRYESTVPHYLSILEFYIIPFIILLFILVIINIIKMHVEKWSIKSEYFISTLILLALTVFNIATIVTVYG